MLKKVLSILCLITIISTINCMEADLEKPEEHKSILDQEAVRFFKNNIYGLLIGAKKESAIIDVLKDETLKNQEFIRKYLPYIYKAVHKAKLNNVIKYIEENLITNLDDKIRCAIKVNDLVTAGASTNLHNFSPKPTQLNISEFRKHLEDLNLDPFLADRILCRTGVNFRIDGTGERYLHSLLKKDSLNIKYKKLILRFITIAKKKIDLPDEVTGNTIFNEALYAYSRYKEHNDMKSMQNVEEIIESLVRNDANPRKENKQGISPKDFEYYDDHIEEWQAERLNSIETEISKTKDSLRNNIGEVLDAATSADTEFNNGSIKMKSNNSRKILTLAGLSIVGAAAMLYFGFTHLNQKTMNSNLKIK